MVKGVSAGLILMLCAASPVLAERLSYSVQWGDKLLGVVIYDRATGRTGRSRLYNKLEATPMGLLDGTFEAFSRASPTRRGEVIYEAKSDSPHKKRVSTITLTTDGGVVDAGVAPGKDVTEFTNAANVPPPVLNPVQAFSQLVDRSDCPQHSFSLYDARRVVEITPESSDRKGTVLTCELSYQVVLGPGHARPLNLKSAAMTLEFDPAVARSGPSRISLRSGPFRLTMIRYIPE